jgi:hypothetical protein
MDHKMGLIVPYRDRESHLNEFIPHMQEFLKGLPYHLCIVEQMPAKPFNRGMLLNIGFFLVKNECDYVCFHDVDMLPVLADYSYPETPTHLATRVEQFDYGMPYPEYLGGVTLFNRGDFEKINGYSNGYWGWGLEDDDLRRRCESADLTIASREGIFHSLSHARVDEMDPLIQANQERFEEYLYGTKNIYEEGLTNLHFKILKENRSGNLSHTFVEI